MCVYACVNDWIWRDAFDFFFFFGIVGLGKIMLIFSNYDLDHTANLST